MKINRSSRYLQLASRGSRFANKLDFIGATRDCPELFLVLWRLSECASLKKRGGRFGRVGTLSSHKLGAVEVLKRLSASKARSVAEDAPTAELANSTAGTIGQRLLKIGRHGHAKHAQVYIRLASAFPLQNVFAQASTRVSKEKNGKPKMECSTYV